MADSLKNLAAKRSGSFRKDPAGENFLEKVNDRLAPLEEEIYSDIPPAYPFLFIFGLPRSGTTITSQVLAAGIDCGYINNFVARYYKVPVTGIRLYKTIYGNKYQPTFNSEYAQTSNVEDIHEFGYFWRNWFKLEKTDDFIHFKEKINRINWKGLSMALANIQAEFDKPLVMKNIFGAMFSKELAQLLPQVLFIYIERDPLDVCCSIMDARKKFYEDPSIWWSTMPPEINKIKGLPAKEQVAAQVFYLQRFYEKQIAAVSGQVFRIKLQEMAEAPEIIIKYIQQKVEDLFGYKLILNINDLPDTLPFRSYKSRKDERQQFSRLLKQLEEKNSI